MLEEGWVERKRAERSPTEAVKWGRLGEKEQLRKLRTKSAGKQSESRGGVAPQEV